MSNLSISVYLRPALLLGALILFLRYGLALSLPFLAGLGLALAAEPAVRFLCRRLSLKRGFAAAIGVTLTLLGFAALGILLCSGIFRGLRWLASIAPDLESTAAEGILALQDWLLSLAQRAPDGIRNLATRAVLALFQGNNTWFSSMVSALPGFAAGLLSHLTGGFLGIGTAVLSAYLISARLPRLKLPPWLDKYRPALRELRTALGGWFHAQARLMGLMWLLLWAGLALLGIRYAPVWAALIALVDAVPMLGTGLILVPWSIVCALRQDPARALGLVGIFVAATLIRSALEPRLLGKQLGLDPLVTLISLYLGYQLLGLPGLLAAPALAVTGIRLWGLGSDR